MIPEFSAHLQNELRETRESGLFKDERLIASPQDAVIRLEDGREVINMCANNYLGLANHPEIVASAREALDRWGFGLASVRFICGTQSIHRQLEETISRFFGTEDTILYAACFDANGGLFEPLLGPDDAIISDSLNHASIIDGIRLCKAKRYRYANNDMADLERQLRQADADGARFKMIATDGVFSMDGTIANLPEICRLADEHRAITMIDDCHAAGFLGRRGRGTPEYRGVEGRIDIITGTLGKALGGASGGFTTGRREVIDILRQRSRPYLFSNTLAPPIVAASIRTFELLDRSTDLRDRLESNTRHYVAALREAGFAVSGGEHPIVPIMCGEATVAQEMSRRLLEKGVYAIGFFYPVVPKGTARVRTQVSAAHSPEQLDSVVRAFAEVRDDLGLPRAS